MGSHPQATGWNLRRRIIDGQQVGPLYSMADLMLKNRSSRIRYEMDQLHDRVMKIKDVILPEPFRSRPW
jgi:hypothetical protein